MNIWSFTICRPFSVSPRTGILNINENMQVTLNFYPLSNGNHCGHLIINYGMGEYFSYVVRVLIKLKEHMSQWMHDVVISKASN